MSYRTGVDFSDGDKIGVRDSGLVIGRIAGASLDTSFNLRATRDGNVNGLGLGGKRGSDVESFETRLGACHFANFNLRATGERNVERGRRSWLSDDCEWARDGHEDGGDARSTDAGIAITEKD
jgi:hypothetical protein